MKSGNDAHATTMNAARRKARALNTHDIITPLAAARRVRQMHPKSPITLHVVFQHHSWMFLHDIIMGVTDHWETQMLTKKAE